MFLKFMTIMYWDKMRLIDFQHTENGVEDFIRRYIGSWKGSMHRDLIVPSRIDCPVVDFVILDAARFDLYSAKWRHSLPLVASVDLMVQVGHASYISSMVYDF